MNYKPDEATLMAYLYGELEGSEKENVTRYFEEHPEELKKLQELNEVVRIMGMISDKEVIAPPVVAEQTARVVSFWSTTAFKTIVSIAASLLLLIVVGKVIGPDITYANRELRISFGTAPREEAPVKKAVASLTPEEVQHMIDQSLVSTTSSLDARWNEAQGKMTASIRQSLDQNSKKVDNLVKNTSKASQDQLRAYVAGLQTENLKLIKDYFQLTSKEQNDYVENLLIGFSKYMQEERRQDLVMVQNKVNDLEKNSDQFQLETEQLLASIISGKSSVPKSY